MEAIKVNQMEEYLDRHKVIVLPVRLVKKFLEECAVDARRVLGLPEDSVISRVWISEERNCLMFEVHSWSYDKVGFGCMSGEEIYLGEV